jgi:hypothetical protein
VSCSICQDLLIDYLYGEIDPGDARLIESHLDTCEDCHRRFASLASARSHLEHLKDPDPSNVTINKIVATARDSAEQRRPFRGMGWMKVAAAFCMLAVVGGVTIYQLRSGSISKEMTEPAIRKTQTNELVTPRKHIDGDDREYQPEAATQPDADSAGRPDSTIEIDKRDDQTEQTVTAMEIEEQDLPPDPLIRAPQSPPAGNGTAWPGVDEKPALPQHSRLDDETSASAASGYTKSESPDIPSRKEKKAAVSIKPAPRPSPEPTAVPVKPVQQEAMTPPGMVTALNGGNHKAGFRSRAPRSPSEPVKKSRPPIEPAPGFVALDNGEYDKAIDIFDRVLEAMEPGDPERPEVLLGLGKALEAKQDWTRAGNVYRQLEMESPAHRDAARQKIEALSTR